MSGLLMMMMGCFVLLGLKTNKDGGWRRHVSEVEIEDY
jgi:hypothetical protein